ncbi:hypothetical protein [Magnetospira sp. QH-2]|uniref:hypothetical protein n=1 Tax=Magnetospira sp. (strain QH-2) TaxID=1288970 RepID=UPI0003E81A5B|nr:hypothetical protein [Magnetospira sp. QH-2]CCQ75665.1 protein of unknown function [Magnetospira sp. QH-2]
MPEDTWDGMTPPKPEEIQAIRDKSVAERTHADQRRLHWAEDYWTNEDIQTETTAFYKLNSEVGAPTGHATGHAPFGADSARSEDARINRQRADDVIKRLGPDADPDHVRMVEAHYGLREPAQGVSMDEQGNRYDAQGRRIANPNQTPNLHKASDRRTNVSQPTSRDGEPTGGMIGDDGALGGSGEPATYQDRFPMQSNSSAVQRDLHAYLARMDERGLQDQQHTHKKQRVPIATEHKAWLLEHGGRAVGMEQSARALKHYNEGSGQDLQMPTEWLRSNKEITEAEDTNHTAIGSELISDPAVNQQLSSLKDGQSVTIPIGKTLDEIDADGISDLHFASGKSNLQTTGEVTVTRQGNPVACHRPSRIITGLTTMTGIRIRVSLVG